MKVKTHLFIDGTNVKDLSKEQLLNHIRAAKARIAELEDTGVESTTIATMIEEEQVFVQNCVQLLDRKGA